MAHVVNLPPEVGLETDGSKAGGWWHSTDQEGRVICDLCPRACNMKPGARGFCFVRENRDGRMVLTTYGRSTGFCVDPIEKKPLNHFLPGTSVLSFGTAGCNLGCRFCQNWSISKSREVEMLSEEATPETIAQAALQLGCRSVAFTYNDPVIWAEYAIDVAKACRAAGIKTVAVTAGYITPVARGPFYEAFDAANVDLKAFTEQFYQQLTLSHLKPVLDTLQWLQAETDVWFEITNLIIPQANDSPDELRQMCDWVLDKLGDEVPIHFTAFHPDFRLKDRGRTPHETLLVAYDIARRTGLKYVYVGNVKDMAHQSTFCPHCGRVLIERDWYELGKYHLQENRCQHCGGIIAGRFEQAPGDWGRKRLPVRIAKFAPTSNSPAELERKVAMTPAAQSGNGNDKTPLGPPVFTQEQERAIHHATSEIVAAAVMRRPAQVGDAGLGGAAGQIVLGSFVSLKRRGRLRGCCGFLGKPTEISEAIGQSARRTATEDMRLPLISPIELKYLDLEVWLLYSRTPVTSLGEKRLSGVIIGKHGLQIQRGSSAGLLLPGVAVESHLNAEGFLEQVCEKANLPPTAWKEDDTQLFTFEGRCIAGPFDQSIAGDITATPSIFITEADVSQLAEFCRNNVVALVQGALASCFLPGCADGTVHALAIALRLPGGQKAPRFSRFSLRPGLPLQSTLYSLAEVAARSLSSQGIDTQALAGIKVELTVLWDPTMHGTVKEPDFDGLDPAKRALLVIEGTRSAWVYNPQQLQSELLEVASYEAQVRSPAAALVLSLATVSTEASALVANLPLPQRGPQTRPPAVAGSFYPAEAEELSQLIHGLLTNESNNRESWPAVMVPHAGLLYSGKIAAEVYRRIQIPEVVIIIGPRHRPMGMEWAVAPHETWSLPGMSVASDPDLAIQLAEAIPDLHLDALAHQHEHSIEVQLPLLAQLAPQTRVVGIVVGAGNLERCRQFAIGLAKVIRKWRPKPLIVISTDMNHYASDSENRRLDEIALSALERLDPEVVYKTTSKHKISMCGILPTIIGLETLRQLQTLKKCQRVAYATSADVTGDKSRVVGYAGMLFG